MKVERMVKRRIEGGGNANDPDEVDIDDWEHRNYKDSWLHLLKDSKQSSLVITKSESFSLIKKEEEIIQDLCPLW